jgi:hypothetical protein
MKLGSDLLAIFAVLSSVFFIIFGVNKLKNDELRKQFPTINKGDKKPDGVPDAAYDEYKNRWEATWMWIGIGLLVIGIICSATVPNKPTE